MKRIGQRHLNAPVSLRKIHLCPPPFVIFTKMINFRFLRRSPLDKANYTICCSAAASRHKCEFSVTNLFFRIIQIVKKMKNIAILIYKQLTRWSQNSKLIKGIYIMDGNY